MSFTFDNKEFFSLEEFLLAQNWTKEQLDEIREAKTDAFIKNGAIKHRHKFYDYCLTNWGLQPKYVAQLWGVSYTPLKQGEKSRLHNLVSKNAPSSIQAEEIREKEPLKPFDGDYVALRAFSESQKLVSPVLAAAAYLVAHGQSEKILPDHLSRLPYTIHSPSAIKVRAQKEGYATLEELYLALIDQ